MKFHSGDRVRVIRRVLIGHNEYLWQEGTVTDAPTGFGQHPTLGVSIWVEFGESSGLPIAAFHRAELEAVEATQGAEEK